MNVYSRHYRSFRQYYNKNRKVYEFVFKFLNYDFQKEDIEQLKTLLEPLEVVEITEPKTSFLHENPVDFPMEAFGRLCTFRVKLWMSITSEELKMIIFEGLQIPFKNFIICGANDPFANNKEEYNRFQQYLMKTYEPKEVTKEEPSFIPQMGYDFRNHDEKDNQSLYGTQRIRSVMDALGKKDDLASKDKPNKLFQFIEDEKK